MKYSGIGGQAVMEGIMMKNGDAYAVAVRKPDQEIMVETSSYSGVAQNKKNKKAADFKRRIQLCGIFDAGLKIPYIFGVFF